MALPKTNFSPEVISYNLCFNVNPDSTITERTSYVFIFKRIFKGTPKGEGGHTKESS